MDTVPYISTVVSICLLALGAIYAVTGQLGRRIDALTGAMNARFDDVNLRFDDVNLRFNDVNQRFNDVNHRFDDLRAELDIRFSAVDGRLTRLESQGETIIGAVSDLGTRVTRLEARSNG